MFTRTLECEARVGKKDELANRVTQEVLPILQNQPGFVDMIALSDDVRPRHLVYLSFWKSKEDAQLYHRQRYEQIVNMIRSLITEPPTVENFTVEIWTSQKVVASKAAA
jgi:heme-degrading monooxygenase HmoA